MGGFSVSKNGDTNAQRRSQRVMLKVSLVVLAQGPDDRMISEETRTVTVSAHGALVLMTAKVSVGQLLTLRNSTTDEEVLCRVALCQHSSGRKEGSGP
jgi:phosphotransferase system HPr-like phosphotransfer protein